MQHLNNNELDKRIHSFLTRKLAELDAVEHTEQQQVVRPTRTLRSRALHWGRA